MGIALFKRRNVTSRPVADITRTVRDKRVLFSKKFGYNNQYCTNIAQQLPVIYMVTKSLKNVVHACTSV